VIERVEWRSRRPCIVSRAHLRLPRTPSSPDANGVVGQGLTRRDVWRTTTRRCRGGVARGRAAPRAPRWGGPGAAGYAASRPTPRGARSGAAAHRSAGTPGRQNQTPAASGRPIASPTRGRTALAHAPVSQWRWCPRGGQVSADAPLRRATPHSGNCPRLPHRGQPLPVIPVSVESGSAGCAAYRGIEIADAAAQRERHLLDARIHPQVVRAADQVRQR